MNSARKYLVSGRVQGVGYRWFVQRWAKRLKLTGHVKNLQDGRVEVYVSGASEVFKLFKQCLQDGPHGARVEDIKEKEDQLDMKYKNFKIKE